jgi:hypothetical protein
MEIRHCESGFSQSLSSFIDPSFSMSIYSGIYQLLPISIEKHVERREYIFRVRDTVVQD